METSYEKSSESYNRHTFRMQSVDERDRFHRSFPTELPATHEFAYAWSDDGMVLTTDIVERKAKPSAKKPAKEDPPTPSEAMLAKARELEKLSGDELDTMAVELGVTFPPRATKAVKASMLAEKQLADEAATPANN